MADKWTPEQLDAITGRDCDLLVAAAAGAGKTAVLVERIIRKITDKDRPVDIDRLLVVTFTNAAATEMRERIGNALADALDADPSNTNLQKQMALLDRASIMTLHSFCLEVVKSHFHSLDLDPLFRIADETESTLIRLDALEELFEEKYENEEDGSMFYRLADAYGGGRDDSGLRELVSTLHRFTRSHPWPEQWLAAQAEAYGPGRASACLSSTPWARVLLKSAAAELQGLSALLRKAAARASRAQGLEPYCSVLEEDIGQLEQLECALEAADMDWDTVHASFSAYEPARLPRCGKDADKDAQEEVKSARSLVKERVRKLYESGFNTASAELEEDFSKLYPQLKYLTGMVNEFEALYAQKKKLKNLLDFNDLEHLCLKVLIEGNEPTAAAKELRERYEEILVDEYQDSNLIQELTLTTVAGKDGGHRSIFMVGDVKQSIYRFRQAKPELFMTKYDSYPREPGHSARTILLYKNFRSRSEVINGVNFIFRQIMSSMVGELEYTESEYLNPGAIFEAPADTCITGGPIELHLLDVTSAENEITPDAGLDSNSSTSEGSGTDAGNTTNIGTDAGNSASAGNSDSADNSANAGTAGTGNNAGSSGEGEESAEEPLDNIQAEARIVGNRIRKLVSSSSEGFSVYDKRSGKYRPAEYRDIVILMRATRNWADIFTDELAAMGIPAYADTGLGYFRTVEVETVLSLLQIIDNPLQDIPLLAVLRSPVEGFDTGELTDIRLADRSVSFYEAMKLFSAAGQAKDYKPDSEAAVDCYSEGQALDYESASEASADCAGAYSGNSLQSVNGAASGNPEQGADLRQKVENFLGRLESWRDASQYTPTDELVWKLMTETGYYSYVGILPGGAERQANLRMLFERARQFEETSYKGLFNFINFINKLRSGGGDMGSAKILGENDNVVRIMSIHKSKGLEFPIVIVAGCGKRFNLMDLNEGILLHQDLGFGPDLVDTDRRTVIPTLPKFAIRQKLRLETLSEEMRILYVAFTRAREKLIITGCVRDIGKTCAKWCSAAATTEDKLPSFDMMQASTYLDWIGPALARHGTAGLLAKAASQDGRIPVMSEETSLWELKLWGRGAAVTEKVAAQAGDNIRKWLAGEDITEEPSAKSPFNTEDLVKALEWKYPFERLSTIPAKISVTELKRKFSQEEETGFALPFTGLGPSSPAPKSPFTASEPYLSAHETARTGLGPSSSAHAPTFTQQLVAKPLFMESEQGISAARKGTVMHFVMQHLDLKKLREAMNSCYHADQGEAVDSWDSAKLSAAANSTRPSANNNPSVTHRPCANNNPSATNSPSTNNNPSANNSPSTTHGQSAAHEPSEVREAFINEIKAQLEEMGARELLTPEEVKIVRPEAVAAFFGTSVGMRMLSQDGIHRETAFNIAIGCSEVYRDLPKEIAEKETMLLQGVIDCWFETEKGILLLDYKTDFVPEGGSAIIKERYKVQLDYYTMALERVTGKKVAERYLYLFYNGELLTA